MSSQLLRKEPCPKCSADGGDTSGDNLGVFDDGHKYCFACKYYEKGADQGPPAAVEDSTTEFRPRKGGLEAIRDRGISKETCRFYGVLTGSDGEHLYPYHVDGKLVAQHVRFVPKDFRWIYDKRRVPKASQLPLFGQHLWKPKDNLRVVVTEGEIDCLTIAQMDACKWPVVSLPSGAGAAVAAIKANYEWLSGWKEIILCFDNDDAGRDAAAKCAEILPPGKAFVVELPLKDANEMQQQGKLEQLRNALWNARPHRPDGIVAASEIDLDFSDETEIGVEWPWSRLTTKLLGRRPRELHTITAGSGVGKSSFLRELILSDIARGEKVGALFLEEGTKDTLLHLIGLYLNKPVRRILVARKVNKDRAKRKLSPIDFGVVDDLDDSELAGAKEKITNGLFLYDHFGSMQRDVLMSKLHYLAKGLGCTKIYLDHVSIVISGLESGNERKDIDVLMTELRSFVQNTGCLLTIVSHLRKSDGRPYEEGGRVSAQDLRGSGSILQLSDLVVALERNQQDDDASGANRAVVRALKDRFGGFTGVADVLQYDKDSGRLRELSEGELEAAIEAARGDRGGRRSESQPETWEDLMADADAPSEKGAQLADSPA